jgi:hypothetical protein
VAHPKPDSSQEAQLKTCDILYIGWSLLGSFPSHRRDVPTLPKSNALAHPRRGCPRGLAPHLASIAQICPALLVCKQTSPESHHLALRMLRGGVGHPWRKGPLVIKRWTCQLRPQLSPQDMCQVVVCVPSMCSSMCTW